MTDIARVSSEPAVDAAAFRRVLGHYPTGVCVVAAIGRDGRSTGFSVGSFTSVSLDPPLVAFCPDRRSRSWPRIRAAGAFAINVLAQDQLSLCRRFSRPGDKDLDGVPHALSPLGAPVLDGVVAWIECAPEIEHDGGDHVIVVARVTALGAGDATDPLLFLRGGYGAFAPFGPEPPRP